MTALLVSAGGTTSGSGSQHLDRLVHQIWGSQIAAGSLTVGLGNEVPAGWEALHRWRVLPSAANPHLLVQLAPRQATFRALTAYRGLRSRRRRLARLALAIQAAGGPNGGQLLVVAQPAETGAVTDRHEEPLSALRAAVGGAGANSGVALVGVRRGANAKPTMQLFTASGRPAGYAKLAWSPLTACLVAAEARALGDPAWNAAHVHASAGIRAPRMTGHGQVGGYPYVMTEPLPSDIVQLRGATALSVGSMATLFPITRRDTPARTGQVALVLGRLHRLSALERSGDTAEVVTAARYLGERIRSTSTEIPVASRWHGDLVPWNAGRDRRGTTWLWDWESSEPDAPAGMDVLHWYLNATGPMPLEHTGGQFRRASESARPALQALGAGPRQRALIGAAYALALAERNAALAAAQGGWHHHRLPATAVLDMLAAAGALLDSEMGTNRA